ncbi:hypothetical protein M378DRAFT_193175 [Amanita muscaria Koide BX008]|uniref:Uncharacterized protein n=1 Tax=Amanita muscaria (strain Koide BX008) TaxID=946122 RepID=A0A0C2X1I5_AMAMK|nr:hypothetical protein M378DRAFT_193175 [Amanita muscaria Koide BX008]
MSSRLTDTEPIANKFNGLYDAIIHERFPSSQFVVTPQYPTLEAPEPFGVGASNFAISFVIEPVGLESPVLFIEVTPPTYIVPPNARKQAEKQIRARFGSLDHLVRIPKLYGISAIGKQVSYYTYDRASGAVEPAALPADPNRVIDTAPVERWANIMQEEGRTKFLAMVEEIKQMFLLFPTITSLRPAV